MKDRKLKVRVLFLAMICLMLAGKVVASGLKLPSLLGDHMVLQQKSKANIWGWAEPGVEVEVQTSWNQAQYHTTTNAEGQWIMEVETGAAGGPYEISITAGNTITLKDILLGEVWICSGQSNMEWRLASAQSAKAEIPASNFQEIRLFTVEKHMAAKPRNDVEGSWQVCKPESAGSFSAVGYFFGKNIHNELGVPVGLINTSWGGTPSEAWTSKATLKGLKEFDRELEELCSSSSSDMDLSQKEMDSLQKVIKKQQDFYNPGNIGFKDGWMKPRFKDKEWERIPVPSEWSKIPAMGQTEGVVWMRTHFVIPEEWLGKTLILELGPVDEMDVTYLNGRRVGASLNIDNWNKNRIYKIHGPQVSQIVFTLVIRVVNTHGEGGLYGTPDQLKIYPEAAESSDHVDTVFLAGNWKYKVAYKFAYHPPLANPHTPTVLYNGMLHPLKNYAIKGAIWYQGESNVGRAMQYREIFPALISDWRSTWQRDEFPFYFVQLAPYKYGTEYTLAELREAQLLTLSRVRHTGMAVTMDIGNPDDIHPTNKRDVGRRLALWALAKDYDREIDYSGPFYKKYQVEGGKIRIFFDHAGSGLRSGSGPLTHFEIAGADQVYVPAIAEIDGETILVSSPGITVPVAVRYAWTNTSVPNLFNQAGLPASSFCTDNWPRVTQGRR